MARSTSPDLRFGDGDVIDLERAAHCAFIVGFGFLEVGESAKFGALRGN